MTKKNGNENFRFFLSCANTASYDTAYGIIFRGNGYAE